MAVVLTADVLLVLVAAAYGTDAGDVVFILLLAYSCQQHRVLFLFFARCRKPLNDLLHLKYGFVVFLSSTAINSKLLFSWLT